MSLGDPELSQLVSEVLSSNLDLAAAVESVDVARAAYGIVAADRLPSVNSSASYRRSRPFRGRTDDEWQIGASVSWELDLFGRVRRSVEASLASFEAQVEDLHGARVALAAETVASYLQMLSLRERLAIAAANVASQKKSLFIAEQRFGAGMTAGLDPAQAEVNLHATQAAVPALELQLLRVQHRLAVLAGREPRAFLGSFSEKEALPPLPTGLMVGLPADLLRNRPDIRGLERRLAAQSAQVGVATAALYPSINLSGSWDWLAASPGAVFKDAAGFGALGPLVSLPIFNAGKLRSQVSAEEATLRQIDRQLRQQVLVAQEEVENALVAIVRDRRQTELLGAAVAAARRSVEFSRQLYTSGQSAFQSVLDAQRSLFSLEDDLARSRLNTLLDLVDLYRALGGGWAGERAQDALLRQP